jgi:transcriptional regulator with GAF, ATPase, and Fis domain
LHLVAIRDGTIDRSLAVEDLPLTIGSAQGSDLRLEDDAVPAHLATLRDGGEGRAPRFELEGSAAWMRARPGEKVSAGPWTLTFFETGEVADPSALVGHLVGLAGALRGGPGPEEAAAAVLDALRQVFHASWGALLAGGSEEDPRVLLTSGAREQGCGDAVSRTVLEALRTSPGAVLDTGVLEDPALAQAESIPAEVRSVIAAELVHDGVAVGTVYLERPAQRRGYQAGDRALLAGLCRFAAAELAGLQELRVHRDRARRYAALRRLDATEAHGSGAILGESEPVRGLRAQIAKVAESGVTALILGETGTGKELVARAVHEESPRREGPFVSINAAAIPAALFEAELFGHAPGAFSGATGRRPGRIELAHGGTLFLDEVGELEPGLQAKLLRVLEDRLVEPVGGGAPVPVDVHLVAATNRSLENRMAAGEFREDLFYRLAVFRLEVPTLRERPEDVGLLAEAFLAHFAGRYGRPVTGLSQGARAALDEHSWPGNVRELRNCIERAVVRAEGALLEVEDLGLVSVPRAAPPLGEDEEEYPDLAAARAAAEVRFLRRVLAEARGDARVAHRAAGVSLATMYNKCRQYGLDLESFR